MREGGGEEDDDEGRVLSADELDISEQEEVASLGEGRFVVGSDGPPAAPEEAVESSSSDVRRPEPADDQSADEDADVDSDSDTGADSDTNAGSDRKPTRTRADPTAGEASTGIAGRDVKSWLADELTSHDSTYAYHITAKSGADVANQQLATDDISAAFDGLLVWYARQVATDTPVDEALGILLAESRVKARYPTSRLVEYLDSKDLGPEDSISDLVAAVAEDDGLVFTKRQ